MNWTAAQGEGPERNRRVGRLLAILAVLVAALTAGLGHIHSTPPSATAEALAQVHTFNGISCGVSDTAGTSEHDPPCAYDSDAPYNAVGRWSHSASARVDRPATPALTTDDYPGTLVEDTRATTLQGDHVVVTAGDLSSRQPMQFAANAERVAINGETTATRLGRQMHQEWDYGPGYVKEFTLRAGGRPDAINFETRHIFELKPNNPRAIRLGERQIEGYLAKLNEQFPGAPWTGDVVTYGP